MSFKGIDVEILEVSTENHQGEVVAKISIDIDELAESIVKSVVEEVKGRKYIPKKQVEEAIKATMERLSKIFGERERIKNFIKTSINEGLAEVYTEVVSFLNVEDEMVYDFLP